MNLFDIYGQTEREYRVKSLGLNKYRFKTSEITFEQDFCSECRNQTRRI